MAGGFPGSEAVTLVGSASTDPDGTIVSYSWTDESSTEIATGVTPTVDLPVGEHIITLIVTDDDGLTASDTVVITVQAARLSPRAQYPAQLQTGAGQKSPAPHPARAVPAARTPAHPPAPPPPSPH
jgi:hypothetical protein